MTEIEQAITYFKDAIRESDEIIEGCSPTLQAELNEQKQHFITGLEALREQAEREKRCEYCKGNAKEILDGDTTIFIDQEDKVFFADWGGSDYLAWEYCPMCGRRLEDKHDQ